MKLGVTTFLFFFFLNIGFSQNLNSEKVSFHLTDINIDVGQVYTSYQVRFPLGKYTILPYSYPFLDSIVLFLKKHDSLIIEISQHSDSRGSNKMSQKPTERRAKSIREYFIQKGINGERLRSRGFSEYRPNLVYHQEDTFLVEKPVNGKPFDRIVLTTPYINQFKENDKRTYEYLHHLNRRTEFTVIGINGEVEKDNEYFSLSSQNLYVGQVFKGRLDFRYNMCRPYFQESDDFLLEERPGMFDSLILLMKSNPNVIFEIRTHTDNRGSAESNRKVAEKRAIQQGNYFIEKGVSNYQLAWKGIGENDPLEVYVQNGKYQRWKPENDLPSEKVKLTKDYINQFKDTDHITFELLHQMNRRTDIVIVGVH